VKAASVLAITLAARLLEKYDPDNASAVQRYKEFEKRLATLENARAPDWSDS
jgi:hypothetical protein